ncbi:ArsR/SmtB family transcription factor [Nocardia sp. NPDC004068]|uniref:ArsR/SmtB family transcription factor n=1 Tax=Nocardia sp. NPDC004068 TaxID=3364303 RepID=UPI00369ECF0A
MATNGTQALSALADPTRRAIFEALPSTPRSVTDLATTLGITPSAVSQHLRVLREARLVLVRPEGTRRLYSLDPRGLAAARDYLDQFWPSALASYSAALTHAESTSPEP